MQQESHFGVLEVSMSVLGGEQMTNLTLPFRDSLQLMNDIGGKLTATSRTEAMNVSNELFDALERVLASPLVWGSFSATPRGTLLSQLTPRLTKGSGMSQIRL